MEYNGSNIMEHILFDKDGAQIIKKWENINKPIDAEDIKCFIIMRSESFHNDFNSATYYFFKTFIIESTKLADNEEPVMRFYNHELPQGILFAIKHFQISPYGSKIGGLTMFENHPEYFL